MSNLKNVFGKVDKLGDLWDRGQADASLIRYIRGLSNISRQGKIFNIAPKKAYATSTYADKKNTWVYDWASSKRIYKLQQHVHCFTNNNKKRNK